AFFGEYNNKGKFQITNSKIRRVSPFSFPPRPLRHVRRRRIKPCGLRYSLVFLKMRGISTLRNEKSLIFNKINLKFNPGIAHPATLFLIFAAPIFKPRGNIMFVNFIGKQLNADAQENAAGDTEATTATTTAPVETAHDDFDWSVDKRNLTTYSKEEKEKYDSVYDNTFVQLNDGELM